jgi:peptidylprolyl isomerase
VQKKVLPAIGAAFLQTMLSVAPANALVNQLADVGLREFLVKDGRQFLRIAQPTVEGGKIKLGSQRSEKDVGKVIQEDLELVRLRFEQVGVTNPSVWGKVGADEGDAFAKFKENKNKFVDAAVDKSAAAKFVDEVVSPQFAALDDAVKKKDALLTLETQEKVAAAVSDLRLMQIGNLGLPYSIPEEFANLPRLNGYATIEMKVSSTKGFRLDDDKTVVPDQVFKIKVDGYHAPLTSGGFVDLVEKKFYDGMPLQKVEQLVVQSGKPKNTDGYVDPSTKETRSIPLEIFYKKDSEPVYGATSDDDARATDTMSLPFQAFGAVGMARGNEDVDSGSSQFFLLKWSQALIAPGRNTLDGFYSCFGYIVSPNEYLLSQMTPTDKIVYAKVVDGMQHLKR